MLVTLRGVVKSAVKVCGLSDYGEGRMMFNFSFL